MDIKLDEYRTRDLGEAGAIYTCGIKLLGLEKVRKHYDFIFKGKDDSERIASSYWGGDLKLDVRLYSDSLRTLKHRLFDQSEMISPLPGSFDFHTPDNSDQESEEHSRRYKA